MRRRFVRKSLKIASACILYVDFPPVLSVFQRNFTMITSIFDPLGYFAPTVLEAKLFMKEYKMPPWGSPAFTFSYHSINHKAVI